MLLLKFGVHIGYFVFLYSIHFSSTIFYPWHESCASDFFSVLIIVSVLLFCHYYIYNCMVYCVCLMFVCCFFCLAIMLLLATALTLTCCSVCLPSLQPVCQHLHLSPLNLNLLGTSSLNPDQSASPSSYMINIYSYCCLFNQCILLPFHDVVSKLLRICHFLKVLWVTTLTEVFCNGGIKVISLNIVCSQWYSICTLP